MRFIAAGLLLAVLQETGQVPPRFRAGIDLVEVDVSVVDRNGRPVRGLSAADFTVLEDGQPQAIVAFDEIRVPEREPAAAQWLHDVAPDVRSNDPASGRLLVLILDDATMPADPRVVGSAKRIALEAVGGLGPQDVASILFTLNTSNSQDFTSDRGRLAAAIDKLRPGFIRRPDSSGSFAAPQPRAAHEDGYWYTSSIRTIRRAAEYLEHAPHRRKALLYISIGVPVEFTPSGVDTGAGRGESDLQRDLSAETQRAFGQAVRSNVTIYGLDPSGLEVGDNRLTREFLQTISENSGGFAVVNTNAPEKQVAAVMADSGSYYLLGFRSPNQKADGKFRRLTVRVNRQDVTLRARRGYYGPRPDHRRGTERSGAAAPVRAAISGVLPTSDLPLHVTAAPFRAPETGAAVAVVTRVPLPAGTDARPQHVDVLTALFDTQGSQKASAQQTVEIAPRPGRRETHYELMSRLDVKPGRYLLRVGAHAREAGDSGSVYLDVEVPDFAKAALTLTGLVVSATPGFRGGPAEAVAALVPVMPTTRRDFGPGEAAVAFTRVQQGGRGRPATVSVASRIVDATGRDVFRRTETLAPEWFSNERGADYRLDLPIATLGPGEYLLRVEATLGRHRAVRDLRFTVRPPPS